MSRSGRPSSLIGIARRPCRSAARRALSLTFSITQCDAVHHGPNADRPSTRCGGTGLEEAVRRDARRCSERIARPALARSWPTLTRHMRHMRQKRVFLADGDAYNYATWRRSSTRAHRPNNPLASATDTMRAHSLIIPLREILDRAFPCRGFAHPCLIGWRREFRRITADLVKVMPGMLVAARCGTRHQPSNRESIRARMTAVG
jgi:hypothetical protein